MDSEILLFDYNKDNLNNNHVSEAAKDLIDRLLQVDPEKRISVEEVANTPFPVS